MLITGIAGEGGKNQTACLVGSILSSSGKKVSVIDSKNLVELETGRIKEYLKELDKNHVDILVLKINLADIENEIFSNIRFDIMIYTDKAEDFKDKSTDNNTQLLGRIYSLLGEKGTAIVNVDDSDLIKFLQGMKYYFVTYGFNSKASITTSSVGDIMFKDGFMCCLQRTISTRNGSIVEPQEYRISVKENELDAHNLLAAATFAIVNDVDLNSVNI